MGPCVSRWAGLKKSAALMQGFIRPGPGLMRGSFQSRRCSGGVQVGSGAPRGGEFQGVQGETGGGGGGQVDGGGGGAGGGQES